MKPRPELHETEIKTDYYETKTKKDYNISEVWKKGNLGLLSCDLLSCAKKILKEPVSLLVACFSNFYEHIDSFSCQIPSQ